MCEQTPPRSTARAKVTSPYFNVGICDAISGAGGSSPFTETPRNVTPQRTLATFTRARNNKSVKVEVDTDMGGMPPNDDLVILVDSEEEYRHKLRGSILANASPVFAEEITSLRKTHSPPVVIQLLDPVIEGARIVEVFVRLLDHELDTSDEPLRISDLDIYELDSLVCLIEKYDCRLLKTTFRWFLSHQLVTNAAELSIKYFELAARLQDIDFAVLVIERLHVNPESSQDFDPSQMTVETFEAMPPRWMWALTKLKGMDCWDKDWVKASAYWKYMVVNGASPPQELSSEDASARRKRSKPN